jgi:hypothetical protein
MYHAGYRTLWGKRGYKVENNIKCKFSKKIKVRKNKK